MQEQLLRSVNHATVEIVSVVQVVDEDNIRSVSEEQEHVAQDSNTTDNVLACEMCEQPVANTSCEQSKLLACSVTSVESHTIADS